MLRNDTKPATPPRRRQTRVFRRSLQRPRFCTTIVRLLQHWPTSYYSSAYIVSSVSWCALVRVFLICPLSFPQFNVTHYSSTLYYCSTTTRELYYHSTSTVRLVAQGGGYVQATSANSAYRTGYISNVLPISQWQHGVHSISL